MLGKRCVVGGVAVLAGLAGTGDDARAMVRGVPVAMVPAPACGEACGLRVLKRTVRRVWARRVRAYGPALLDARAWCESGSHGLYALSTTGNGYWFAMQFDVAAWAGAGGRVVQGRPVGRWSWHPSRLEQRARAVVWDQRHDGDPWPNCP